MGENTFMLLSKYKSFSSLSPNHLYLLGPNIVIVFFSSMALRLGGRQQRMEELELRKIEADKKRLRLLEETEKKEVALTEERRRPEEKRRRKEALDCSKGGREEEESKY